MLDKAGSEATAYRQALHWFFNDAALLWRPSCWDFHAEAKNPYVLHFGAY